MTNDDGVESPGIQALAAALAAGGHELLVVAPSGERSGSGAAIGRLHRSGPIACTDVEWPHLPGVAVHAIDSSPAAAVYAGCLGAFGPPPDIVASGVNPGANTGHLVLHSGTVGAALTAAVLGVPGPRGQCRLGRDLPLGDCRVDSRTRPSTGSRAAEPDAPAGPQPQRPQSSRSADVAGVREAQLARFGEVVGRRAQPGRGAAPLRTPRHRRRARRRPTWHSSGPATRPSHRSSGSNAPPPPRARRP